MRKNITFNHLKDIITRIGKPEQLAGAYFKLERIEI